MRRAIDIVLWCLEAYPPQASVLIIGRQTLLSELQRYWDFAGRGTQFIESDVEPRQLERAIMNTRPGYVIAVTDGSLAKLLLPIRASPFSLGDDLPTAFWKKARYEVVRAHGIQGIGSMAWALSERIARRLGRFDLADQCRVATMQTMSASRMATRLSTILVREYRSAQ